MTLKPVGAPANPSSALGWPLRRKMERKDGVEKNFDSTEIFQQ
jgi:hypothetical protein